MLDIVSTLREKSIYKSSIKKRLILSTIFILIMPISIILLAVYDISVDVMVKKINNLLENNFASINYSIDSKFNEINNITNYIYLNPDLLCAITPYGSHGNPNDIVGEITRLDKLLETYYTVGMQNSILFPKIYILNRPEYSIYNYSSKIFDLGSIDNQEWYQNLPTRTSHSVVGRSSVSVGAETINTIKLAKQLYALDQQDVPFFALLTIDISVTQFESILNMYLPSQNSKLFVIDNNSSLMLSTDYKYVQESKDIINSKYIKQVLSQKSGFGTFACKVDNKDVLVAYNYIKNLNWITISVSPVEDLFGDLIVYRKALYIVLLVSIFLAILVSILLAENITSPIRKVVRSMATVKDTNFDINIVYTRNDEFGYLINTYKKMLSEIKELFHKLYISENNKKEAELKALQAQINPHFLYNTLDSVNWMAIKHKVPEISTMVTSLSDFFRYSLSKGKNIITLHNEIRQVESYLNIQSIRFKDKLEASIACPKEVYNYLIVKLSLQPLVENAIVHGIEARKGKGCINILVEFCNNNIEIMVIDDGVGGDIDELNSMIAKPGPNTKSFGILNVNERLRQTFGNAYGLKFYNNVPTGIIAKITIPAVTTPEGYYVKNDNC